MTKYIKKIWSIWVIEVSHIKIIICRIWSWIIFQRLPLEYGFQPFLLIFWHIRFMLDILWLLWNWHNWSTNCRAILVNDLQKIQWYHKQRYNVQALLFQILYSTRPYRNHTNVLKLPNYQPQFLTLDFNIQYPIKVLLVKILMMMKAIIVMGLLAT